MARAAGRELTLTLAVHTAAQFVGSPSPTATIDGIRYKVEGTADLNLDEASVIEAPIALEPSVTGLPDLGTSGWKYHTFILQGVQRTPRQGLSSRKNHPTLTFSHATSFFPAAPVHRDRP